MPPPLQGWNVSLVPDQRSVDAIARQIKASGRAFSVFDVGRLFMESRDRYQVRFTRRPPPQQKGPEGAPAPGPQGPPELFQCVADGSLWLSRDEAIRHLLNSPALTKYYRTETVTHEAPKGNWSSVAVCGFSGTLLGPPNHHDYQRNVARLHRERFSDMSLERFKSRIRVEKDEALLQKWQESQSTATQYVSVAGEPLPEGAEPPVPLKSVAEMEAHFLKHHAAEAAVPVTKATVPGNIPGKFLAPPLFGLLRTEVERQQRFPMQLVQDLCRDLENQGLRFFKRDKKTTFVCRNRPHFLPDDMVLSDRIRAMVEMVRANPGITYSRLVSTLAPHIVAFVPPPAPEPAATVTEVAADTPPAAETEKVEEAPPVAEVSVTQSPESESPVAPAEGETAASAVITEDAAAEMQAPAEPETVSVEAEAPAVETPEAPAPATANEAQAPPAASAAAPPAPAAHLSPEEIAILQDLHWLVQEGYVTEFQNGELFVLGRPPQPPAEKKHRPQRPTAPAAEGGAGEAPPTETQEETQASGTVETKASSETPIAVEPAASVPSSGESSSAAPPEASAAEAEASKEDEEIAPSPS
jgi:hypothetical protein